MKPSDRQKICSQCDGRVPIDATECFYCGMDLSKTMSGAAKNATPSHASLEQSLQGLYSPSQSNRGTKGQEAYLRSNYTPPSQKLEPTKTPTFTHPQAAHPAHEEKKQGVPMDFWGILALCIGSNLLMLGLLQVILSDHGMLRLEWSSSFWYLYCLLGAPAFWIGFKKLH